MATLITGGAGFIGLEVVRLLLSRGEKRPLVMSRNPSLKRLGDVADEVEVMRGDLGNFSHVLEAVKKARPQVIYHLGATLSVPSEADPASAMQTNAMGTFHVLERRGCSTSRRSCLPAAWAPTGLISGTTPSMTRRSSARSFSMA